jgi:hypothetical protein
MLRRCLVCQGQSLRDAEELKTLGHAGAQGPNGHVVRETRPSAKSLVIRLDEGVTTEPRGVKAILAGACHRADKSRIRGVMRQVDQKLKI